MVHPWALPRGERDVVAGVLPPQPSGPEVRLDSFSLCDLRAPEPEFLDIPFVRRSHVRQHHIEVVEAHDPGSPVVLELLEHPFLVCHLRVELDRESEGILGEQGLALALLLPSLHPPCDPPLRTYQSLQRLQPCLVSHPEGEVPHPRGTGFGEGQAVVMSVLEASEIHVGPIRLRDHESEGVGIEPLRLLKVSHQELDVPCLHYVEGSLHPSPPPYGGAP